MVLAPAPTPVVSVCIPTYRGATHLAAAIDSVLGQSYSAFELLIVDDNSPDDSAAIVARYRDSRVRWLPNARNLGPKGNWNRCLDAAAGRYFKLLPQDDVLAPECLQRQVQVLEDDRNEEVALVFSARTIIDAGGRALMVRGFPNGRTGRLDRAQAIRACLHRGTNVIGEPGCVLMRTSLARKIGNFDDDAPYVIDLDYWLRLLEHGKAHYLAESLASFRVSRNSWSVAIGKRQSKDFSRLVAKLADASSLQASRLDLLRSKVAAWRNAWLRLVFYRLVLPRRGPE